MDDSLITISDKAIVTKTCITCHKELPIQKYGKRRQRSSKPDGHWIFSTYGECKNCANKRKALWRSQHPDYMKEWYQKQKKNEN
jgi:hypothetical protein